MFLQQAIKVVTTITITMTLLLSFKSSIAQKVVSNNAPWIRVDTSINHVKVDPKKGRYIAYSDKKDGALHILDLKTHKNITVSKANVDGSFVWSPDGIRVIYRDQAKRKGVVTGALKVFDLLLNKSVKLEDINSQSGFVSFDPRDYRVLLMHEEGVVQKSIKLPDSRLAKWQLKSKSKKGRWVASSGGIVFISATGKEMQKLNDDNSGVSSFDISPDGTKIVWATNKAGVYFADDGNESKFLDHGRDPKWNPESNQIIYAGAHTIGTKVSGFDLKVMDLNGSSKWLTKTSLSDERWPAFLPNGAIIYTKAASTDFYSLEISSQ